MFPVKERSWLSVFIDDKSTVTGATSSSSKDKFKVVPIKFNWSIIWSSEPISVMLFMVKLLTAEALGFTFITQVIERFMGLVSISPPCVTFSDGISTV